VNSRSNILSQTILFSGHSTAIRRAFTVKTTTLILSIGALASDTHVKFYIPVGSMH